MRGSMPTFNGRVNDTGWVNLQLVNGWVGFDSGVSLGGSGRAVQIRRLDGVVHIRGVMRSGTSAAFAALPVGFRPATTTVYEYCCITATNGSYSNILISASNGSMEVSPLTAASQSYTYLAGLTPWLAEA